MREYAADWEALQATDPEVAAAVAGELGRERSTLRLIASENFASPAVLAAVGSTLNNKYAEGYPGRRYYGGCQFVDVVEQLAIDRAKQLFGAEHANVQSHAGATANMAVFGAFLEPKDPASKVLGHGAGPRRPPHARLARERVRACGSTSWATRWIARPSSSTWIACATSPRRSARRSSWPATPPTRARSTSRLSGRSPTRSGRCCGSTPRTSSGLVAGGAFPSPVPHADVVTFTTHKALRGPRGAMILCKEEHAKAIDKAVFPMMQGGPIENNIAGKAVALKEAMSPEFADYAHRTVRDARALAAGLADEGMRVVSGGTDSHLAAGRRAAPRRRRQDGRERSVTRSASRSTRTRSRTTRTRRRRPRASASARPRAPRSGMDEAEMREIAGIMGEVLRAPDDAGAKDKARGRVRDLTQRFPLYP